MADLPGFSVEEGIHRFMEIGMLEWIRHLRPTLEESSGHYLSPLL